MFGYALVPVKVTNQPYQGPMPFQYWQGQPQAGNNGQPGSIPISQPMATDQFMGGSGFGNNPFAGMTTGSLSFPTGSISGVSQNSLYPMAGAMNAGMSSGMNGMNGQMMGGLSGVSGSVVQTIMMIAQSMAKILSDLSSWLPQLMASAERRKQQQSQEAANNGTGNNGNDEASAGGIKKITPSDSTSGGASSGTTESGSTTATGAPSSSNAKMQALAAAAKKEAQSMNTEGQCLAGVQNSLDKVGLKTDRKGSAYELAPILAKDSRFEEVKTKDLKNLPAGAIVVWQPKSGHPHGHISVALGNGKEASSKLRNQITNYGSSFQVFIPKG